MVEIIRMSTTAFEMKNSLFNKFQLNMFFYFLKRLKHEHYLSGFPYEQSVKSTEEFKAVEISSVNLVCKDLPSCLYIHVPPVKS